MIKFVHLNTVVFSNLFHFSFSKYPTPCQLFLTLSHNKSVSRTAFLLKFILTHRYSFLIILIISLPYWSLPFHSAPPFHRSPSHQMRKGQPKHTIKKKVIPLVGIATRPYNGSVMENREKNNHKKLANLLPPLGLWWWSLVSSGMMMVLGVSSAQTDNLFLEMIVSLMQCPFSFSIFFFSLYITIREGFDFLFYFPSNLLLSIYIIFFIIEQLFLFP